MEYSIVPEDIYNFNKTGFQMRVATTVRIITSTKRKGQPQLTQPRNRK